MFYWIFWISAGLEPEGEPSDHPLGRVDDEQLVVHRRPDGALAEEVADRKQHFPPRAAKVHEGQRLADLDVEASVKAIRALDGPREGVAHSIQEPEPGGRLRYVGLDRRR